MLRNISNGLIAPRPFIGPGGVQLPPNIEALWSDEELAAVGLERFVPTPTKDDLRSYADRAHAVHLVSGVSVNVAAEGDPALTIHVSTTLQGLAVINGAALLATLEPARSFTWAEASGPVTLSAAQIIIAGKAAGAFVQASYDALAALYVGIEAGGVESYADIDAWDWTGA